MEDDRESQARARRARYAARHAQADAAPSPPQAPPPQAPTPKLELSALRAALEPRTVFRALKRRLPPRLKQSKAAEPAKWALRQYRRRFGPPKPPPPPLSAPPSEAEARRWRQAVQQGQGRPPRIGTGATPRIAALVLNRNGAHHLRKLFESLLAHEPYPNLELVVVDHGSTDESRTVLGEWSARLRIRAIYKEENHSFSRSTNDAAQATDAELLLLLNNDLIWTKPILAGLVAELEDEAVGLVGCSLRFPAHYPRFPGGLQHDGIKFFADREAKFLRPYNLSARNHLSEGSAQVEPMAAVTAALALCRRADYQAVGGLYEGYFYGYEDVDLALRIQHRLQKSVVIAHGLSAVHDESATQNRDPNAELRARRQRNRDTLDARFGLALRRQRWAEQLAGTRRISDAPLVVGFAVTEAGPEAKAGDYYTALELAAALERRYGYEIRMIARKGPNPYDVRGVDILVNMNDGYDLRRLVGAEPGLFKVAWLRGWFDRWVSHPWFQHYDQLWVSSDKGQRWLLEQHGRRSEVLRIATSAERFQKGRADPSLSSDYAFTGNYWGVGRDIEELLDPAAIGARFALYGAGWETRPLAPHHRGFLEYRRLPDAYASTKLVIDDAIFPTKPWASVNSRVFDATAAGALVLTNGDEGAREVFGGLMPTFETKAELSELARSFLSDEPRRQATVQALQRIVLAEHTYERRAEQAHSAWSSFHQQKLRIAIKVPAPNAEVAKAWGDYHFALALRRCFWRQGHAVRIDLLPDWHGPQVLGDDVVLVLRGLSTYRPDPKQVNLMWNISHPDRISDAEYESYDQVFVASVPYAQSLARLQVPVTPLLQCTDPALFYPSEAPSNDRVLFVGNSRKQRRPIVMDAIAAQLPLDVYGMLWEGLIPDQYRRGEHVDNTELRQRYAHAGVVLNDHWGSMRDQGFISNRLFDAVAAGAIVISDPAAGLEDVFGDGVMSYETVAELRALAEEALAHPQAARARARAAAARVLAAHTFEHRAQVILEAAARLQAEKERGAR